ncbi:MAG: topoisomerase DNA-binding C4 zinc finger domain-containing protein, partial [Polyangiaceae bacterium]|nr:topoisomerase DNA-binding C4 zinc finger domain-containing protein [Polyangiaceae bacterium]
GATAGAEAGADQDKAPASKPPSSEEEEAALLPDLNEGDALALSTSPGVITEQKFTQPPPRYNEGSLVRELEKRGIGRPSTYAEIISKVQQRAYVEKRDGGAFQPTMLGKFVVDGLVKSQLDIMDPNFTAQMEEELDEVGTGKIKRSQLLKRFYKRFREQIEMSKKLASWKPKSEKTDIACEECGAGVMIKKWGKNGWFLSCERYPKCKATRDLAAGGGAAAAVRETDFKCDKCGKPMVIKTGRFGDFLSCTGYPACKNARPVPLGVACPSCGGDIIEIRPRKKGGRTFYGCSNYNAEQKCDFKLWQRPIPEPCPNCGAAFLTRAGGKKPMLICATKDCGYKRALPETDEGGDIAPGEGGGEESLEATGGEAAPKAPPKPKETAAKPAPSAKAAAPKASKPVAKQAKPSEATSDTNGSKGAAKPAAKARNAEGPRSPKSQAG